MLKPFPTLREIYRYSDALRTALVPGVKLRFVNWYIQHACDLDCFYCKVPKQKVRIMSKTERLEALKRLYSLCVKRPVISILGGEPTLRPDFFIEVVAEANEAGFLVNAVSNGWGLTPELVRRLGETGLHYLGISVDCEDGAEKSNLSKAFEMLTVAKENGIIPVINTVITSKTETKVFKGFAERIINEGFFISPLACSPEVPGGVFSSASEDAVPTLEQLRELIPWLAGKKVKTGLVTASFSYLWTLYNLKSDSVNEHRLWHCSANFRAGKKNGRGFLTLDSDGYIGPCQEFPRLINLLEVPCQKLSLQLLDSFFGETTRQCPGCLHNCYVMEEGMQGPAAIAEGTTLIQVARIKSTPVNVPKIRPDKSERIYHK